jgi:hypothetical protein
MAHDYRLHRRLDQIDVDVDERCEPAAFRFLHFLRSRAHADDGVRVHLQEDRRTQRISRAAEGLSGKNCSP